MECKEAYSKGFSLVELIIVIAIMAVLIGVLTPIYIKYVRRSQAVTDAANADEIALAINVAIVGSPDRVVNGTPVAGVVTYAKDAAIITDAAGNVIVAAPASKVQDDYKWFVRFNAEGTGVTEIRLGATSDTAAQIWPSASAYQAAN